jgi:excisionase family DNA binding protein
MPAATRTSPTYLTTRDVEELIRVDKSTIYRMAESGKLPAIKVGRQWRFPADEMEQWLRGHEEPRRDLATADLPGTMAQDSADLFADLFGVMVVVTDIEGRPVTAVSNPCGYFTAVSQNDRALERCIAEWKALGSQYDFEPTLRPSHLGFLCTRAYVRSGNELTGMVIAGGIAGDDWPPTPRQIEAIAAESGVDTTLIEDHALEVHRLDATQREAMVRGVSRLARHLSRIASRDQETRTQKERRSTT